MSKRIAWLTLVVLGVGCGGTSETNDASGGASSQGGTSHTGGSVNTGGGVNTAGSVSSGGSGSADPRCPAKMPTGMCGAADAGLSCQYDRFSNCLCYAAGLYSYCQPVDSTCTFDTGSAGTAGGGGAGTGGAGTGGAGTGGAATGGAATGGAANSGAAGSAGAAGSVAAGGFQAKVAAAPQHQVCTCSAGAWTCNLGF